MAHGRGQEILGGGKQGGGTPGLAVIPTTQWSLKVVALLLSLALPSRRCTEGKATVILVLFTGHEKNPTSKSGKNSASEEDHLPLQVLQSH